MDFCLLGFEDIDDESAGSPLIYALGIDNDIFKNWDDLTFHSNFRGIWLALNGVELYFSITETSRDRVVFTSPVLVNGQYQNLRFAYLWDDDHESGRYEILGLWSGLSQSDCSSAPSAREGTPLQSGDEVTVIRRMADSANYTTHYELSKTVTIGPEGGVITEEPLCQKNYQYIYAVTDIFGRVFYSSSAVLAMTHSYEDLMLSPLPDGVYAAEIIAIGDMSSEILDMLALI